MDLREQAGLASCRGIFRGGADPRWGLRLLRMALLALLALAAVGGGSLAGGDLFDDDYADCPHRTRLRDGQIADLTLTRDAEEADEVNVSWTATDPDSWGLGSNAFRTALVLLLDDGEEVHAQRLALGARQTTFAGVETVKVVTAQMAIVVDTADGDYLISDILEQSLNQSLRAPAFRSDWKQRSPETLVGASDMYYIGYSERFSNYRATSGLPSWIEPRTPKLRIGVIHGDREADADDRREDVEFASYILRMVDADGDVVPEVDDMPTVASDYIFDPVLGFTRPGFLGPANTVGVSNVRINDGGEITRPMQEADLENRAGIRIFASQVTPASISWSPIIVAAEFSATIIYAPPPDAHRDFPVDVVENEETYTITAWAVNEDREVISPKASLRVHPRHDYRWVDGGANYLTTPLVNLVLTEFTVLR